MVMHYWARVPGAEARTAAAHEEVYRRLYVPDRGGILLADMKRFLEESAFDAFTFRGQWADIQKQLERGRPLIAGLRKKPDAEIHFVVVTGSSPHEVRLNDPARKRALRLTRAEFLKQWELAGGWLLLAAPRGPA
jgi:ABC-type bacteriocin/lantibiotic exporter with double-glycine peptidase domain